MGGEVGDVGVIYNNNFEGNVIDCINMPNGQHLLKVETVYGNISLNEKVTLIVNEDIRKEIEITHSATHLLDQALKDVIGSHVFQHGSLVEASRTRFDFNNYENVSNEKLIKIEKILKEKIADKLPITTYELPIEEAKKEGCVAVFGEKYGSIVRIVNIGNYSKEFCGGCHTTNTENIIDFAISSIESKGSGIFRIEAVTGANVIEKVLKLNENLINDYNQYKDKYLSLSKKAKECNISLQTIDIEFNHLPSYEMILSLKEKIEVLKENIKLLDKEIKQKENTNKLASFNFDNVDIETINNNKVIFVRLDYQDGALVKQIADTLQDKYNDCIIFVMSTSNDKIMFIAKCNNNHIKNGINCGRLVKEAAILCGGNGGGRPDFAQAGGKDISKAPLVFDHIRGLL